MIRAAVTLVLGDKEAQLERSGLVQLVSGANGALDARLLELVAGYIVQDWRERRLQTLLLVHSGQFCRVLIVCVQNPQIYIKIQNSTPQAVEFSRKLSQTNGLPAFNPEDGNGDQMVMFSGPTNDVFLDVHNFSSAEVRMAWHGVLCCGVSWPCVWSSTGAAQSLGCVVLCFSVSAADHGLHLCSSRCFVLSAVQT